MCCNPYNIHTNQLKSITKGLRLISEKDRQRFPPLIVGKWWCNTYRKYNPDPTDFETTESDVHISSQQLHGKHVMHFFITFFYLVCWAKSDYSSFSFADVELSTVFAQLAQESGASEPSSQEFGAGLVSQLSGSSGSPSVSPRVQKE